jgi:hypothetical protein
VRSHSYAVAAVNRSWSAGPVSTIDNMARGRHGDPAGHARAATFRKGGTRVVPRSGNASASQAERLSNTHNVTKGSAAARGGSSPKDRK